MEKGGSVHPESIRVLRAPSPTTTALRPVSADQEEVGTTHRYALICFSHTGVLSAVYGDEY